MLAPIFPYPGFHDGSQKRLPGGITAIQQVAKELYQSPWSPFQSMSPTKPYDTSPNHSTILCYRPHDFDLFLWVSGLVY